MSRSKSFERGVRRQGINIMKSVMPKEEIRRIKSEKAQQKWQVAQDAHASKPAVKAAVAVVVDEDELAAVRDLGTPRPGEGAAQAVADAVHAVMGGE